MLLIFRLLHFLHIKIILLTQLPEPFDDWTHNVTVNPMGSTLLPFGERCTFFGCFVYCNIASCERVRRNFLEENVTIGKHRVL